MNPVSEWLIDVRVLVNAWLKEAFGPLGDSDWGRFWLLAAVATLAFVVFMAALHRLSPRAKKWLTIVLTFVAGLHFLLEYLLPLHDLPDGNRGNVLTPSIGPVSDFVMAMTIWTLLLGLISLGMVHGKRLFRRQEGWHNSLALFIAFFAMIIAGIWSNRGHAESNIAGQMSVVYSMLYEGIYVRLEAAMFALLAFYISSAAYRAFRIRSLEATLLMIAAVVVMLGFVSIGLQLTAGLPESWRMDKVALWILQSLNMPVQRAVTIGVSVGALAMALRIWLGLERGAFFSQEG
jgi:hypothetical protein